MFTKHSYNVGFSPRLPPVSAPVMKDGQAATKFMANSNVAIAAPNSYR